MQRHQAASRGFACGLSLLQLLVVSTIARPARANMAAVERFGDPVTEPYPAATSMHIVHEDLSIDMRDALASRTARIRARYRVRNDGPAQAVELFFVAPGLRSGQVRHQGKRIPARETGTLSAPCLPPAW